jgi:hypothetical protein
MRREGNLSAPALLPSRWREALRAGAKRGQKRRKGEKGGVKGVKGVIFKSSRKVVEIERKNTLITISYRSENNPPNPPNPPLHYQRDRCA